MYNSDLSAVLVNTPSTCTDFQNRYSTTIDTIHGGLHLKKMKSYTEVVTIPCSADVYTIQCCLVEQGT